ncbi:hypothetical protein [Neolewinella antarctica]|uniref:Outer membrane protein beta-barrel domain-containing protein n=1 Tax=Neolewinella antarctica TaxID=442734 RepID=A0ABX0X704_9BACT|nr:hypothetical protein [Neolewinella antarctica]NJC24769.1 hypothetical protein [Neolewinella antarctica]
MNRTLLLSLFAAFLSLPLTAQFGVTTTYNINNINGEALVDGLPYDVFPIDNGYEIQAHYWFRLPNKRIEFQPTVFYAGASIDAFNAGPAVTFQDFGFQFEVNVYPFDFGGDCGCPTFGKQGPKLEKGFFVQLFPGIARRSVRSNGGIAADLAETAFVYGGGIGLDIGVSNLLTLTPIATVRRGRSPYASLKSTDGTGNPVTLGNDNDQLMSYQLGIQATFRFDKKRY